MCARLSSLRQLIEGIQGVDRIIGQLMNGLKQIGLHRCLNIIIVADHGKTDLSAAGRTLSHHSRQRALTFVRDSHHVTPGL